jgi:hypothetical protein
VSDRQPSDGDFLIEEQIVPDHENVITECATQVRVLFDVAVRVWSVGVTGLVGRLWCSC